MDLVFLCLCVGLAGGAPPLALESRVAGGSFAEALPLDFAFGAATAAFQIEGAAAEGGRGPSIWDTFSHMPGKTWHGDTGDVADDHYHLWALDVALLKSMGLKHYRLSVSWSRLMPLGRGALNAEGVNFYSTLLRSLRLAGIEPLVTLYHWDLPQALEDEYGGWLAADSELISKDFAAFAAACFSEFGEWVDTWLTFNEALTFVGEGYGDGVHAPGRCSDRARCVEGDSQLEPLRAAHNVLLAHAVAVAEFRTLFRGQSHKQIGMTNCGWMTWPLTDSPADALASQRLMEAQWAWFFDPVVLGDYPESLKQRAGDALPRFTDAQKAALRGSIDFLGVNYYTARWTAAVDARHPSATSAEGIPFISEFYVATHDDDGTPIGVQAGSPWLFIAPTGLRGVLRWLSARYGHVEGLAPLSLCITENGLAQPDALDATPEMARNDTFRIDYLETHLEQVSLAVNEDGVDVTGYYAWSLLDNFEWGDGYSKRFGMVYVDYATQERTPKRSALWYAEQVATHAARSIANSPHALLVESSAKPPRLPQALAVLGGLAALALPALALRNRRRRQASRQQQQESLEDRHYELVVS